MAKRNSRKQVLKAFVLTIGVADCAGIYVVNSRLSAPVPDDLPFDLVYALPADQGVFRPDHANRQSFAMAPTTAVPQETTLPEPRSAAQPAPVVPLVPAPVPAGPLPSTNRLRPNWRVRRPWRPRLPAP